MGDQTRAQRLTPSYFRCPPRLALAGRCGAPVSAPISWDELGDQDLRPDSITIRATLERVARRGDLFVTALGEGQRLPRLR